MINKLMNMIALNERKGNLLMERGSSVVECLTHDGGAVSLSLIGITALCP